METYFHFGSGMAHLFVFETQEKPASYVMWGSEVQIYSALALFPDHGLIPNPLQRRDSTFVEFKCWL